MKKLFFYLIIGLLTLIGGFIIMNKIQKTNLVKQAQAQSEVFIYDNYEGITDVHVSKDNYSFTPMGGLGIGGYVNGNKDLSFHIKFFIIDGNLSEVTSIVTPQDFPIEKEACKDDFCQ